MHGKTRGHENVQAERDGKHAEGCARRTVVLRRGGEVCRRQLSRGNPYNLSDGEMKGQAQRQMRGRQQEACPSPAEQSLQGVDRRKRHRAGKAGDEHEAGDPPHGHASRQLGDRRAGCIGERRGAGRAEDHPGQEISGGTFRVSQDGKPQRPGERPGRHDQRRAETVHQSSRQGSAHGGDDVHRGDAGKGPLGGHAQVGLHGTSEDCGHEKHRPPADDLGHAKGCDDAFGPPPDLVVSMNARSHDEPAPGRLDGNHQMCLSLEEARRQLKEAR
jgi:hypothetical protein